MSLHSLLPAIVPMMAAIFLSCTIQETTTQIADTAFLVFEGASSDMEFQLDEAVPKVISRKSGEVRYEIRPGKHTVVVMREGREIVTRLFFVSTGQVFVLRVPGE